MAKPQKQFSKGLLVTNINMVINNRGKYFCIIYKGKTEYIEHNDLISMCLATILDLIVKQQIYLAKVVIKEKVIEIKPKDNIVKTKALPVTNCKTSLDEIYGR